MEFLKVRNLCIYCQRPLEVTYLHKIINVAGQSDGARQIYYDELTRKRKNLGKVKNS